MLDTFSILKETEEINIAAESGKVRRVNRLTATVGRRQLVDPQSVINLLMASFSCHNNPSDSGVDIDVCV